MILFLCKVRRERKPGWLQNAKALLTGTRDLLPLTSTCRCSRTNEWNSTFAGSISDPLTQHQVQVDHPVVARRGRQLNNHHLQ